MKVEAASRADAMTIAIPRRILLVEDSGFFRRALAENLRKRGFGVLECPNGEQAVALARIDMPDLILLDMMMPRLDGMMFLRMLRSDPETKSISVIVLTGSRKDCDQKAALKLSVDGYYTKDSIQFDELLEAIEKAFTARALVPIAATPEVNRASPASQQMTPPH